MEIIIKNDYSDMSTEAARIIGDQIKRKPNTVLGLATGSTPLGLYNELIKLNNSGDIDFSNVITYNLDEYIGLTQKHPQSYKYFMYDKLFSHINIKDENIHVPNGEHFDDKECELYEDSIKNNGGIDIQILGIGRTGHIAFNEPTSSLKSRTRIKTLTQQTIKDNSRFFNNSSEVPIYAITMGVGTIMEAKKIILMASGKAKAKPIKNAIEGPISSMCSASAIQMHQKSMVIIDEAAASKLSEKEYYKWVYKNKI